MTCSSLPKHSILNSWHLPPEDVVRIPHSAHQETGVAHSSHWPSSSPFPPWIQVPRTKDLAREAVEGGRGTSDGLRTQAYNCISIDLWRGIFLKRFAPEGENLFSTSWVPSMPVPSQVRASFNTGGGRSRKKGVSPSVCGFLGSFGPVPPRPGN